MLTRCKNGAVAVEIVAATIVVTFAATSSTDMLPASVAFVAIQI